ncbi:hypothetical protein TYRP_014737 [Tyrophagus putrescentiae]|nr:hypothetical protein TYRP_014737 [Tyrophagus putrescentiae]
MAAELNQTVTVHQRRKPVMPRSTTGLKTSRRRASVSWACSEEAKVSFTKVDEELLSNASVKFSPPVVSRNSSSRSDSVVFKNGGGSSGLIGRSRDAVVAFRAPVEGTKSPAVHRYSPQDFVGDLPRLSVQVVQLLRSNVEEGLQVAAEEAEAEDDHQEDKDQAGGLEGLGGHSEKRANKKLAKPNTKLAKNTHNTPLFGHSLTVSIGKGILVHLGDTHSRPGKERPQQAAPKGESEAEHERADRPVGLLRRLLLLDQAESVLREGPIGLDQAKLQQLLVGNEDDHGDEEVDAAEHDAHAALGHGLSAAAKRQQAPDDAEVVLQLRPGRPERVVELGGKVDEDGVEAEPPGKGVLGGELVEHAEHHNGEDQLEAEDCLRLVYQAGTSASPTGGHLRRWDASLADH